MRLGIIGTGYVGLVTGVCFAENGNNVICMDIDKKKISRLKQGDPVIYEPQVEELLNKNIDEQRISFTTNLKHTVESSKIIFLCLPTPSGKDGSADISSVLDVTEKLAEHINEYKVIVSKSTVPAGTCEHLKKIIAGKCEHDFDVVSNPEFLKEGAAVSDFMSPDRVIVGTRSKKAAAMMKELYSSFMRISERFLLMDERSAELAKYAANAMLALRVSFMNELSNITEKLGADIDAVRSGVGSDLRIGSSFLFAGAGYGGSCFPKDVKGLMKTAEQLKYDFKLLKAIDAVNENQKLLLAEKVKKHYDGKLKGKVFTVWGLSYKPRTDDIREAPSITIIEALVKAGAKIQAYDPAANDKLKEYYKGKPLLSSPKGRQKKGVRVKKADGISLFDDNYEALRKSDGLILVTEWNVFRKPDFEKMKSLMRKPVIFDGRNIYNPRVVRGKGFVYYGIGR